ncbi:hypothetical protein POM88_000989 [Heracleum sosnowskyi]|uniref:Uncharacterized protein n=1 Tax=Heracleum sosnowskyi TaxID=360622 RepID=A0AAD8JD74_9APIA|nr:hypothetical protein POM88_000989 [Heracleum sosnowskyi]
MRWNQLQESDFAIILNGTHEVWHDCSFKFNSFQLRGPLACTFRGVPALDVRMDNELPKYVDVLLCFHRYTVAQWIIVIKLVKMRGEKDRETTNIRTFVCILSLTSSKKCRITSQQDTFFPTNLKIGQGI